jgi:hypothetical protein
MSRSRFSLEYITCSNSCIDQEINTPPQKKTTTRQRRQKPCNHHPHTFSNKCIVFHVHQRVRPPGLRLFPFESHVHVVQQFRVVFFRSCFWSCFLCVDWIVPWIFFWTWNVMLLPDHLPRQKQRNREKTIKRSKKHTLIMPLPLP